MYMYIYNCIYIYTYTHIVASILVPSQTTNLSSWRQNTPIPKKNSGEKNHLQDSFHYHQKTKDIDILRVNTTHDGKSAISHGFFKS
jgi:hypothetical protein